MKRIMFRLGVALTAFCVGVGCELMFKRHSEPTSVMVFDSWSHQPKRLVRTDSILLEISDTQIPAGSLPVVLQRIDEKYKKQCQLPTDWDGEWRTLKQLAEFRACNDKWAQARREAIKSEIVKYLIVY